MYVYHLFVGYIIFLSCEESRNRVSPLAVYTFYFFGNTATHSVYKNFRTSIVTFFQ